jgi:hypothetical protein
MLNKNEDGATFNIEAALESLTEKYGLNEKATAAAAKKESGKKRKNENSDDEGEGDGDGEDEDKKKSKKPKAPSKTSIVAEEKNRAVAEAIKEMADIYFKNKDMRKGGVFSKAAKAIRECETVISTKKDAMALKGIGKGIAGYIEEFFETGTIEKLEELRAGTA